MGERMDRRWYCEAEDHSVVLGWPPCAVKVRGEGQMEGGIQELTFVLLRHARCEHRLMRRPLNRQRSSLL